MKKNESYSVFLEMVANCVRDVYKGEVIVENNVFTKNNGVQVQGLMLRKKEEKIAPNFYLDKQYEEWKKGTLSLYDIVTHICNTFEIEVQTNQQLADKICFEWDEMKKDVFPRLINRDKNKELLEKIPYIEFMDLAVVYFYSIHISEDVQGTVVLTKEHLKLLGITKEQLHQTAQENVKMQYPMKLYQMGNLIATVGKKLGITGLESYTNDDFMYIFSNESTMFGAIAMFFEDELKKVAERLNCNFYVLPSSVHEVILVPENTYLTISVENFLSMVKDINATQVKETEVLSDSVYYYDRAIEKIRRVG